MEKVAILLSTYNSSLYLQEQIDSIINQTYQTWRLYIRDDGSTDTTGEIIACYCTRDPRIIQLKDDVLFRGAKNSFIWLLNQIEADYYMFCDHDDVWLPHKIEISLEELKRVENIHPRVAALVNTDLKVVDHDLNEISSSFWRYTKLNQKILLNYNYLCAANSVTGCTSIFNAAAKRLVPSIPESAIMHDWWIALCVTKYGVRSYCDTPTVLYRQHGRNVFGATQLLTNRSYFFLKVYRFKEVLFANIEVYKMMKSFEKYHIFKFLFFKLAYLLKR